MGEKVRDGVKREVKEETDITIRNLRLIDYIDGVTRDKDGRVIYHFVPFFFIADYKEGTIKAMDDALNVNWITIDDIMSKKVPVSTNLISILKKISI